MCKTEVNSPMEGCTGILIELIYSVHLAFPGRHSTEILAMYLLEQWGISAEI